jgi:hypothetical protein
MDKALRSGFHGLGVVTRLTHKAKKNRPQNAQKMDRRDPQTLDVSNGTESTHYLYSETIAFCRLVEVDGVCARAPFPAPILFCPQNF